MHSSSFRPSELSDPFGRYYSAGVVGQLLVSQITVRNPNVVLDLGAGAGALSHAAQARWRDARILRVDIDPAVTLSRANKPRRHVCQFRTDALDPDLATTIRLPLQSVAAAVCNPPFIRPRWRPQFAQLLEAAGLSGCYPAIEEAGAAVLFLAQNIRFLRIGGQAGLIVPDGVASGISHRKLRRTLLEQHCITDVIELPGNAFAQAQVKTHIMVVCKGRRNGGTVRLRRFEPAVGLTAARLADIEAGTHRLDYSYYDNAALVGESEGTILRIRDVAVLLERGRGSMVECAALRRPVFHTTSFPDSHRISVTRSWCWTQRQAEHDGQTLAWPGRRRASLMRARSASL